MRPERAKVAQICDGRVTKAQFMIGLDVRAKKPVTGLLRKRNLTTYFKHTVRRR